jgi:hypothetical protein
MEQKGSRRRFRLSIRTLMIAIALCALMLAPIAWMVRRTEAMLRAERLAAESAKAQADRARYLRQLYSAKASLNGAEASAESTAQP